ncbi:MAG: alpha/beta fold hydrolase [Candidatus Saccharimonadales bacterium]
MRNIQGEGQTVVLLHGVGRTAGAWKNLLKELEHEPYQVATFDLLGHGNSPKPQWPDYNVDDHAKAVIKSIITAKLSTPVILVGHSMGCLIALRVARLRPDLVKHLILYEMPLFKGLPNKRVYRLRLNFYYRLYKMALEHQPSFESVSTPMKERIAKTFFKLEIDKDGWEPFIKSLEHTIFEQTAPEDIKKVSTPMDVIYGNYDMLVIKGSVQYAIESGNDIINQSSVRAGHRITKRASVLIHDRIKAALKS